MICVRKYAKNQNQIKFETHGGYRRHLKGWNIQPETFRRLHSRLQIIINNIHFSPQMKHERKDKKKHSLQLYLTTPTPQTHISNWHLSTNMFPASKSNLSVNIHSTQRTSSPPPPPHLDASRRSHSLSLFLVRRKHDFAFAPQYIACRRLSAKQIVRIAHHSDSFARPTHPPYQPCKNT